MLSFFLGSQPFALPVDCVRAVRDRRDMQALSSPHALVAGTLSHGPGAVPVIDGRVQLVPTSDPHAGAGFVIVVEGRVGHGLRPIGLLVDDVAGVMSLGAAPAHPTVRELFATYCPYVTGVLEAGDALVLLLDPNCLFAVRPETG